MGDQGRCRGICQSLRERRCRRARGEGRCGLERRREQWLAATRSLGWISPIESSNIPANTTVNWWPITGSTVWSLPNRGRNNRLNPEGLRDRLATEGRTFMNRREFVCLSAGAITMSVLSVRDRVLRTPDCTYPREASARNVRRGVSFGTEVHATDQGRIAYIDKGNGPAALFLHGFPLNSFQWRGVIPQLSKSRRCIAPDFLALGYTEVADGQSVAPQAQLKMLVQLLDKLSISSIDIVANDSGGAIAQLFVAHHPERVRSLLLTNCDTEPDSPPAAVLPVIELARAGKFADEWLVPWLADKALARSEKGLGGQCYANPAHPTDQAIEIYLAPAREFCPAEGPYKFICRRPRPESLGGYRARNSNGAKSRRGSFGAWATKSSPSQALTI